MGLLFWVQVEETVYEVEILSGKEKVPGVAVSKEGYADNLLQHEKTHHYWFLWTVNSVSYCELLRQNSCYLLNEPHICLKLSPRILLIISIFFSVWSRYYPKKNKIL